MSRIRGIGRKLASGIKPTALSAAAGAGFAALEHYLLEGSSWYDDNWWAGGAIALAIGFILPVLIPGSYTEPFGHGLASVGGYMLTKALLNDEAGKVHGGRGRDAGAVHSSFQPRAFEASGPTSVRWVQDEYGNVTPVYGA